MLWSIKVAGFAAIYMILSWNRRETIGLGTLENELTFNNRFDKIIEVNVNICDKINMHPE